MSLTGANLVAGQDRTAGPAVLESIEPRTGVVHAPRVHEATEQDVNDACRAAQAAVAELAGLTPVQRGDLLRAVADALDHAGPDVTATADRESALGVQPRLEGELARTTGQLRFLAGVVEEGSWLEATIDHRGDGPAVRRTMQPLGPVAVFAASNFPLAFSIAGGDTAAALAVGCPVVAKAHPSHPHTSELVGRVVSGALAEAGLPPGSFSLVHGLSAGQQLVTHPSIQAVAFTGSFRGGRALVDLAAERDVPIPVYAEMGSLNPVVVTPEAASARTDEIAEGFVASMTLGAGQFCTKPGLLFVPAGASGLEQAIADRMSAVEEMPLLNAGIGRSLRDGVQDWSDSAEVEQVVAFGGSDRGPTWVGPGLVAASTTHFIEAKPLHEERFGPVAVLVRYQDHQDLTAALGAVPGSLAAAIHASPGDDQVGELLDLLSARAGRVVWNDWPTGVAVVWSMHHGGPYPATSDPLHTSVGAASLRRFLRPVGYQGLPDEFVPPPVQDTNPWKIPQRIDGALRQTR